MYFLYRDQSLHWSNPIPCLRSYSADIGLAEIKVSPRFSKSEPMPALAVIAETIITRAARKHCDVLR